MIAPGERRHPGPCACLHSTSEVSAHSCPATCIQCGYYCHKEEGHVGLHDCVHGIAWEAILVTRDERDDVGDEGEKGWRVLQGLSPCLQRPRIREG